MRFDLVDLRLFLAVVEAGTISHAAKSVNLALGSASARISGMEATLGVPLLERGRRGVTPTPAGHTLAGHARTVLAQIERMHGDLNVFGSGLKGRVRVLSNTASLVELLPSAIRGYLSAYPDVDIELDEQTSAEIVFAVAEGRADFGVVADSADPGDLETMQLAPDRLVLLAPRHHRLTAQESVSFADVLDEPFVGLSGGALERHLADHASRLGRRIKYRVRLRSFDALARLVEAGIGVGIMPYSAAIACATDDVTIVSLSDPWATRHLLICARQLDDLTRHARALVDEIVQRSRSG